MDGDLFGTKTGPEVLKTGAELQSLNALSLLHGKQLLITEDQRDNLITVLKLLASNFANPAIRELSKLQEIENYDYV